MQQLSQAPAPHLVLSAHLVSVCLDSCYLVPLLLLIAVEGGNGLLKLAAVSLTAP